MKDLNDLQDVELSEQEANDAMMIDYVIVDDATHTLTTYFCDGRVERYVVAQEYDSQWQEIKNSLAPLIVTPDQLN